MLTTSRIAEAALRVRRDITMTVLFEKAWEKFDEFGSAQSGSAQSGSSECTSDFFDLVGFQEVPLLNVIESGQANTALKSLADLFCVILFPFE